MELIDKLKAFRQAGYNDLCRAKDATFELTDAVPSFLNLALEEFGEWDEVYAIAQETMQQGNSAARQRDLYKRTGSLEDVVDFVVQETAKGTTAL